VIALLPRNNTTTGAMISPATSLLLVLAAAAFATGDVFSQRRQRKGPVFAPSTSRERKPNIVLILTDDQDVELGSLNFMPKTLRAIRDQGAQFRHAYVTTPMCCPSRSSLLTGMYVHNHHVYTNNDNCSSTQWQATYETRSFATYLSNAGYRTGYFGKYLNKYNGSYVPPGWREWGGLIMNSKYYNYSINMNGKKIKHGFDYHKDYYPDLIANDSIAFLRQSKKNSAHKPVMLTMSFPAPHGPEDSAPQYSHLFFNVTTHHTPSYDYAPNPDKQWILQVTKKMQPIHKQFTDLLMTKRLQTLQSVDAAVQLVVEELEALGELDNTYIIYTSDHGYHLGQFGLIKGKSFPFEFDVRIPFLVRGPGVEPGTVVDDIVLNIDLAPTFLDIAGVEAPPHMDGRSVLPLFLNSKRKRLRWPDTFLIESSGRRETPYLDAKARTRTPSRRNVTTETPFSTIAPGDYSMATSPKHAETTTAATTTTRKVYESGEDLTLDSFADEEDDDLDDDDDDEVDADDDEIDGGYDDGDDEIYGYSNEANVTSKNLIRDNDMAVETRNFPANKLERLSVECALDEMKPPCRMNQKWYCVNDNGRWRKHKCKSAVHVPFNTNKSFRKCACFTEAGLVYRKIPMRNITRRHTRFDRIKRAPLRLKRDALDHVETAMKDVQGKLTDLKNANASLIEPNLATNTISEGGAGCVIINLGRVNCSTVIYQDRKSWRQSRHMIDNEIYQLKQKLEKLKEIRRHLKHTKPISGQADEDEDAQRNKTLRLESPEVNELSVPLEQEYGLSTEQYHPNTTKTKRKRKRPHDAEPQKPLKRPRVRAEGETTEGGARVELTTSGPYFGHSNPHRHHKYFGTTRDDVFSTVVPPSVRRRTTTPSTTTTPTTTTTPKPRSSEDVLPYHNVKYNDYCHCEPEAPPKSTDRDRFKDAKRKLKEDKLRRKLRKQRKKDQLEKECASERMNCFHHDKEHWKTAPMWTEGPFCFCMNANNNTYSCVRTINSTHNFLYCEFTTGLVTFYNLRIDPFELQNRIDQLKPEEKSHLHDQLRHLMGCKGRSCTVNHGTHHHPSSKVRANALPLHAAASQHRYKKRKMVDEFGNGRGAAGTLGSTPGVRISTRERARNSTAMMGILREAGIRRRRRKT
jgi:extracellular sulfatase Sulf